MEILNAQLDLGGAIPFVVLPSRMPGLNSTSCTAALKFWIVSSNDFWSSIVFSLPANSSNDWALIVCNQS